MAEGMILPFDGPATLQPGDNVRFYKNGWRYGKLDSVVKNNAKILYAGHIKTVPLKDVEKC